MTFKLKTISIKTFLWITLISVPIIVIVSIVLGLLIENKSLIILAAPLLILIILFAQKQATKSTNFRIENQRLIINERSIDFDSIHGYNLNESGLTMLSMELKLNSEEIVSVISSKSRKNKEKFNSFSNQLLESIRQQNPDLQELKYQDVHTKQMRFLRPTLFIGIGIVLIIDILIIYSLSTGINRMPWQALLVNVLIIGLIPYLKRKN